MDFFQIFATLTLGAALWLFMGYFWSKFASKKLSKRIGLLGLIVLAIVAVVLGYYIATTLNK